MKLSVKLALSMILLVALVLSAGSFLFVRQDFRQSYANLEGLASDQHNRQLAMLQLALDEAAPDSEGAFNAALYRFGSGLQQYGGSGMALDTGMFLAYDQLEPAVEALGLAAVSEAAEQSGRSAQMLLHTADGYRLLLCSTLEHGPYSARLVTAHDMTAVYTRRDAQIRRFLQIGFATLAVTALASVVIASLLTRPLRRLNEAAGAIADGQYTARTGVKTGDEIGQLSRSFDRMAEAVEGQIGELNLSITQRDDFISAFTHEIKTPMTGIIGYADILRESDPDPATLHTASDAIYHDAKRLEALSGKLLLLMGLEREESLPLVPVPLRRVFRAARSALGEPEQMRWENVQTLTVLGDADLLTSLVQNLVQNSLRSLSSDGLVLVTAGPEGDKIKVEVADNGCGIPADKLGRITEPFYMVDKSRARRMNGSGMGLALCARIAALHGTQLCYQSAEGVGTRCSFLLEVANEE